MSKISVKDIVTVAWLAVLLLLLLLLEFVVAVGFVRAFGICWRQESHLVGKSFANVTTTYWSETRLTSN